MILIELEDTLQDNSVWQELLAPFLKDGASFEIHCWEDEADAIALALQYGHRKDSAWRYGTVIAGEITPSFRQMLAETTALVVEDGAVYNKQTPFFSIFLENFSSSHYGTEIYVTFPDAAAQQTYLQRFRQIDGITISQLDAANTAVSHEEAVDKFS